MTEHTHDDHQHAPHAAAGGAHDGAEGESPEVFWERMYAEAESGAKWTGRVNHALETYVAPLEPGTSLDLGCGEGGDVLWLAEHGWQATGIDLSRVAVERARAAAEARGLDRAHFVAADLAAWADRPAGIDGAAEPFDLVTASFFQSPVELPRQLILRAAAARVAVGGHLLVVSHAAPPPGMDHPGEFPSPADELAALALDPERWEVLVAEVVTRPSTRPDAHAPTMDDTVVYARRTH